MKSRGSGGGRDVSGWNILAGVTDDERVPHTNLRILFPLQKKTRATSIEVTVDFNGVQCKYVRELEGSGSPRGRVFTTSGFESNELCCPHYFHVRTVDASHFVMLWAPRALR